jgi:hypothetical protein
MAATTRFDAMTDAAGSRPTVEGECMTTTLNRHLRRLELNRANEAAPADTVALTDAEREICELMGVGPADYVRRRAAASAAEAVRVSGCPPRENEPSGRCADEDAPSRGGDPAACSPGRSEVHDTNRTWEARSGMLADRPKTGRAG